MAMNNLNKSIKSTPTSKGGYLSELTASIGKTTNYPLPVRIKVTPSNKVGPLSDGKKNPAKLIQPVLIKDLFPSSQRDRNNSTFTSVSTQKKRFPSQRPSQPYLNTQSCGRPKREADPESSFLLRKSYGGSKVRRQLYQNLDSPPKVALGNKENSSKVIKCKKKSTTENEFVAPKNQVQSKNRTSLLLPPNSIRNSFLKSGSSSKPPDQTRNVPASKSRKTILSIAEVKRSNQTTKDSHLDAYGGEDVKDMINFTGNIRDQSTMTTPTVSKNTILIKNGNEMVEFERPSVIMSPQMKSNSKYARYQQSRNVAEQNVKVQTDACNCEKTMEFNETHGKESDLPKVDSLDFNNIAQFKSYLEESIKACENQVIKYKAMLDFLNTLPKSNSVGSSTVSTSKQEKSDSSHKKTVKSEMNGAPDVITNKSELGVTDIYDANIQNQYIKNCSEPRSVVSKVDDTDANEASQKMNDDVEGPVPINILITDISQETTEVSSELLSNTVRLSTIGEVSCEVDDSNKEDKADGEDSDNKENINEIFEVGNFLSPKTPKTFRRKSVLSESCERRRSARLAAKRMSGSSLSDSDKQDSFTMLENELDVKHETMSSRSLPTSPMKPPITPGTIRLWDKKVERPLQEYMALKMNGTFLVTPDVKRFQSCLETTDTPHSRKSLSRKIFMELCDLYAESPERE